MLAFAFTPRELFSLCKESAKIGLNEPRFSLEAALGGTNEGCQNVNKIDMQVSLKNNNKSSEYPSRIEKTTDDRLFPKGGVGKVW